jgi:hypothetical protein
VAPIGDFAGAINEARFVRATMKGGLSWTLIEPQEDRIKIHRRTSQRNGLRAL